MGVPNWDGVLDAVQYVSSVDDLDDFGPAVLERVERLIGYDLASFNEVDPLAGRASAVFRPDRVAADWERPAWERWSHQNPALMHMLRSGDGSARRISDYLTPEQLHRLELYTQLYAPLGTEYQLSVGLPAPRPVVVGIALNRSREDFADDEVAMLEAMRPHLVQAYRRTQLVAEQRAALRRIAGALAEEGRAFHVLDRPLEGEAADLVERHWGPLPGAELPPPVAAWVAEEERAFRGGPLDRLRQPLVSLRDGRRLTIRYLPGGTAEPALLALKEQVPEQDAQPLCRLGLSARQAEVLWWLTKGASTVAIAKELGVSTGTVKKHLDHVYRKLGVSNRTGAVAQAFDALAGG